MKYENELLKKMIYAANEASKEIISVYKNKIEIEFKTDSSPLTIADKLAHNKIFEILSDSGYPIISEEGCLTKYNERKDWNKYWLVDPLDGTKEFINKNDNFTVNIALIEKNVPLMGVVMLPVSSTIYIGYSGGSYKLSKGVDYFNDSDLFKFVSDDFKTLNKLSVSKKIKNNFKISISSSHENNKTNNFLKLLESMFGTVEKISIGSSVKLCLVAEGKVDCYPRLGPTYEWDTAAAHAVVNYAGGNIYKFDQTLQVQAYFDENQFTNNRLVKITYNKENLINPYFIVSGIHKYNV